MYLVFHVTVHDYLIERSCKFMDGGSLCCVTTPISLNHKHRAGRNMFMICHVTSGEHMFKWFWEFIAGSLSQ